MFLYAQCISSTTKSKCSDIYFGHNKCIKLRYFDCVEPSILCLFWIFFYPDVYPYTMFANTMTINLKNTPSPITYNNRRNASIMLKMPLFTLCCSHMHVLSVFKESQVNWKNVKFTWTTYNVFSGEAEGLSSIEL